MARVWSAGRALLFLVGLSLASADIREDFYNRLRDLIDNRPPLPNSEIGVEQPREVVGWGTGLAAQVGQISGVSVNSRGQPVIFHRGPVHWDEKSFNRTHHYQKIADGPIQENTVVVLDPDDGSVVSSWGAGFFYLPHGITIDHRDNTWLTDVAMHQVMKFPLGWKKPTLRLGEQFCPGKGRTQLCKPTSVAIATNGEIYVADGYCNSRILKFSHNGFLQRIFPHYGEFLSLVVPHSLSLLESRDLLCVADRENMRVVCFKAEVGQKGRSSTHFSPLTIHQPDLGRVFAIASKGDLVYAVNGPTSSHIPVQGFTLDPFSEVIVDHWAPQRKEGFSEPHDIAISPKGDELYVSELGPVNKLWKFTLDSNYK